MNTVMWMFRRAAGLVLPAVFVAFSSIAKAQDEDVEPGPCDPPTEPKIVKLLSDAAKAKDPVQRHNKLKETLEIDPECAVCLFQLGLSAYQRMAASGGNGYDPAIDYLERLNGKCPEYHADVPYLLGAMYYAEGNYGRSKEAFDRFLKFPTDDPKKLPKDLDKKVKDTEEVMTELTFYADLYRHSAPLAPVPLRNVNTGADEYLPMLSPDNELLFFTRKSSYKAKGDLIPRDVEQLSEARRPDLKSDFDKGEPLPEPFNLGDNYGGVTISLNNKELFVTVCAPPDAQGYRNCDIFRTHFETRVDFTTGQQVWEWGGLDDLGPAINTPDGWESQPSLSTDGKTLYFATVRKDSRATDIYYSTRDDKGVWSKAVPVPGINTDGDEKAPFLHSDSHTLYFAARPPQGDDQTGLRGMGGYDIFFSHLNEDGSWTKPKNLGYPINSDQDEHGLIVSADGRTGYFASGRLKGAGGLDIFGFELPKDVRPEDILVVKGEVRDEKGELVRDAQVEIKYMDTRRTEMLKVDSLDGRYATVLRLKPGADVVVTVQKKDHVFDSRLFTVEDTVRGGVAEADMRVARIETGRSYRVNDIRYATGSAEISKSSEHILDELIDFLKENPTIRIEIQGHTDNVGTMADNMALSHDRAFNVMDYLQHHGVVAKRLQFKGFGPTKPVATNDTDEGRASNRRTEFVIIGR